MVAEKTTMIISLIWGMFGLVIFYGFHPMVFITIIHHHLGKYFWNCFSFCIKQSQEVGQGEEKSEDSLFFVRTAKRSSQKIPT